MPVRPNRLDGVAADVLPTPQLKAGGRELLGGRFVFDHDVGLAFAHRTRAGATQCLEIKIALMPILPRDGENVVHGFDVFWLHFTFVFPGHGQSLLIEQFGQMGFLAVHTRRPWNCSR